MLLQRSEALRNTQHFTIDEKGVTISQDGEEALLEWKQVYKVVDTKSNLLVYSTRVNAYVFPKRELGDLRGRMQYHETAVRKLSFENQVGAYLWS